MNTAQKVIVTLDTERTPIWHDLWPELEKYRAHESETYDFPWYHLSVFCIIPYTVNGKLVDVFWKCSAR